MKEISFRPHPGARYLAFNKPFEVLCQFTQPPDSNKRTLAEFDFPKHVYSVGRLDYDSEGLLILSDDNRLNDALLNPHRKHFRTYLAHVENVPDGKGIQALKSGVLIENKRTAPARAQLLEEAPELWERSVPIRFRKSIPTGWIELSISEGRNRQVRKMTAAIGCPTLRLVRVAIGELELSELDILPGEWRDLTSDQVLKLFANSQTGRL